MGKIRKSDDVANMTKADLAELAIRDTIFEDLSDDLEKSDRASEWNVANWIKEICNDNKAEVKALAAEIIAKLKDNPPSA